MTLRSPSAANDDTDFETAVILPHMLSIGLKKYAAIPAQREAAARLILRNAIRLAELHLGRSEAAALTLETLQERG